MFHALRVRLLTERDSFGAHEIVEEFLIMALVLSRLTNAIESIGGVFKVDAVVRLYAPNTHCLIRAVFTTGG